MTATVIKMPEPQVEEDDEEYDVNILTPEDAANKACPFGIGGEPISKNGFIVGKRCIGELCMAWVWETDEEGSCALLS